ncbi:MAG: hypothetical protein VX798_11675 [Bacteroidota bacterium]|uniref:Uncharacterized protein n=1 Tax=Flagellimonas profundi TaxID=2915620 RepID=A0ABS3FE74_9FLAO|nr:hypothetical protein [Allomuricauda profundi]MBO0341020.1 hypothetical protein [Allomuricauda profundi]MEC7771835.1 hypothetical protein [Bacteroidota bacterium]
MAKPNLILRNGKTKKASNGETTEYIFLHDEQVFTVEHIPPTTNGGAHFFFLEVSDESHKKSTWKMEQMPIPKYLIDIS